VSYNIITGSSLHIETFKYEIGHFEKLRRLHLRGNHLGNLERLTFTARILWCDWMYYLNVVV
jgi:hypothetical protein